MRENLPGVEIVVAVPGSSAPEIAWGDTFFIYDPDGSLPESKHFPFATIVTKDYGDFDNASKLDRLGVFRLNIDAGKDGHEALFGSDQEFDFTELDVLMPHPVYGRNHWVCVLNPSDATFEGLKPLLTAAYKAAVDRFDRVSDRASRS